MTYFFQFLLFSFIILSFILVITVPVLFSSTQEWKKYRGPLFSGLGLWIFSIFAVGLLNSFVV